jgi:beta-glucosidase-like glycosyl hydrolase
MRISVIAIASALIANADVDLVARPWMDAAKTPDERVALILPELSIEEKVNQLLHVWATVRDSDVIKQYGNTSVGAMYVRHLSANMSCNALPHCRLKARNTLQKTLIEGSVHGIPMSFVTESLHSPMMLNEPIDSPTPCATAIAKYCPHLQGPKCESCVAQHASAINPFCPTPGDVDKACGAAGNAPLGTIFPMPALQGCSWNRTAVRAIAAAVATESRAVGADRGFSPEIQVATDPRFGRTQENFGGDPFLVSELGVAAVLGLHGGDTSGPSGYLPNYNTTVTSEAKHYAAYGYGDADGSPADVSITTLYDIYLRPWKAYVKAGGRGAMPSHNSVNGIPCHSNKWLLSDVLRTEFGCEKCLIATDYRDIQLLSDFNTANTTRWTGLDPDTDASIQALVAGVDQDLGARSYGSLIQASKAGLVPPPTAAAPHGIDAAAGNVLRAKVKIERCTHDTHDAHMASTHLQASPASTPCKHPARFTQTLPHVSSISCSLQQGSLTSRTLI